jgi:hypothetical protein
MRRLPLRLRTLGAAACVTATVALAACSSTVQTGSPTEARRAG